MTFQQPRAEDRHRRILDAALQVFSRKGYRDASVDDIAGIAQTSKGGVYFHFPNKEAIFLTLLKRTATRLLEKIAEAAESTDDPIAKADAVLLTVLRTFAKHRTLARTDRSVSIIRSPRQPDPADLADLAAELRTVERGLVVCGPQEDRQFPAVVTQLAEELDFPLLADPLSQVRCGAHYGQCVIDSYDAFLRVREIAHHLAPDLILRLGATPVSKPLLLHLQRHAGQRHIFIEEGDGWHGSTLATNEVYYAHPRLFCKSLLTVLRITPRRPRPNFWKDRWIEVGTQTRAALQASLQHDVDFSEPRVFAELADLLPPGGGLSFYHDLNGLLAVKQHTLQATIILLHNDATLLARIVGHKKARKVWFLCRQCSAQQALEMGLVNAVVPLERLEEETVQGAREILNKSPTAIRFLKAAFMADTDGLADLRQLAGDATLLYYLTDEAKEGRNAFVEKRKPDFSKFPRFP